MTLKEAVLQSLEEIGEMTNYSTVCEHIITQKYYDFKKAKTPSATISAVLGDFIRNGDTRVRRIKESSGTFLYYLARNEENLDIESAIIPEKTKIRKTEKKEIYDERDLHKLLSSYLKTSDIYSKTIFHEQSNRTDEHQKWIHPDMVGIKFLKLQTNISQTF
ncbi:MAG: HTH domain-containing protein, partial [Bacteroidales bacterium]|nr:HTH domain-containing protein [Bacteroidales bacterium]